MEHSIQTVKDRFNSGEPLEYVFFWGHHTKLGKMTKACFIQWFPADFVVDDVAYNCTEQYMMAEKARVFGDDDIRQKMLACNDPKEIKALGLYQIYIHSFSILSNTRSIPQALKPISS